MQAKNHLLSNGDFRAPVVESAPFVELLVACSCVMLRPIKLNISKGRKGKTGTAILQNYSTFLVYSSPADDFIGRTRTIFSTSANSREYENPLAKSSGSRPCVAYRLSNSYLYFVLHRPESRAGPVRKRIRSSQRPSWQNADLPPECYESRGKEFSRLKTRPIRGLPCLSRNTTSEPQW